MALDVYSCTNNYCKLIGNLFVYSSGEHIDYCGYGVLPMAIEQDMVIAAAPNHDNRIVLSNMDPKFQYDNLFNDVIL